MYDHVIKIKPNIAEIYNNRGKKFRVILGIALANLGKFHEAIIMYHHALKINPNDFKTYFNEGRDFILF